MRTIALIAALCAAPAGAQELDCAYRPAAVEVLTRDHGEVVVGYGLRHDGQFLVEAWVSESGSWTLTITGADGVLCVLLYGSDWVFNEQPWPNMDEEG